MEGDTLQHVIKKGLQNATSWPSAPKEILEGYFLKAQFAILQEGCSDHTPKSYVLLLTLGCWKRNLSCCSTLIGSYISVREVEWA
jgi:hypothetical protein